MDSYEEYLLKDYRALKKTSRKALKSGIDFYLLRMRIAILAYEHHNYTKALRHFKKAYEMNPNDSIVQEYLYFSFLLDDQYEESRIFALSLNDKMQTKIGFKKKNLESVSISSSFGFNENIAQNLMKNNYTPEYKNVQSKFIGNSYKFGLLLNHSIGRRVQISNGFTYFGISSTSLIQTPFSRFTENYLDSYLQYNFGLGIQMKKGWNLSGGLGFYHSKSSWFTIVPNFMMGPPRLETLINNYNNISFSSTISKRMNYFLTSISFHFSNLLNQNQSQGEFNLTYYPFGNSRFFSTSSFSVLKDTILRTVFSEKIGMKCGKRILIEGEGGFGDFTNKFTSNGFIIYNTQDKITSQIGANIHFYSKKKFEFIASYYFQSRVGINYLFLNKTDYKSVNYKYNNNNLTITLKWNF